MSNELSTEISPEIINSLILTGDMSKLTAGQQTQYYTAVCKSVGINPITQPFAIITLQGKKTLYATKGCTQQLSDTRGINTEVKERKTADSVYIVSVRATMKDGRFTDEDGVVSIVGLKGAELANAMMKAITKAKRRAVLALCGLGMPDESEVDDIHPASDIKQDPTKSRLENIIDAQATEVPEAPKAPVEVVKPAETVKKAAGRPKSTPVEAPKQSEAPAGLFVTGIIEEQPKSGTMNNPKTGKPEQKFNFNIGDKVYGTFDQAIIKGIMNCIDNRILIKIQYINDRKKSDGTFFNDIIGFEQVTTDDIPLDEVK